MKEVLLAAALFAAVGIVIGFAIESIGRASRRDAKRRNQEPPMVVPPPGPVEWWNNPDPYADDWDSNGDPAPEQYRAPRGRIDRT